MHRFLHPSVAGNSTGLLHRVLKDEIFGHHMLERFYIDDISVHSSDQKFTHLYYQMTILFSKEHVISGYIQII